MERTELLNKVAPCGLLCSTCTAAKDGTIKNHSKELLKLLENFDGFAEKFSDYEPRLKNYPKFIDILHMFSDAGCEGCRGGNCMFPGCPVEPCTTQKGIDFCFECETFPCVKMGFDRSLKLKWITANRRMKEVCVQVYFIESKDKSHYS